MVNKGLKRTKHSRKKRKKNQAAADAATFIILQGIRVDNVQRHIKPSEAMHSFSVVVFFF